MEMTNWGFFRLVLFKHSIPASSGHELRTGRKPLIQQGNLSAMQGVRSHSTKHDTCCNSNLGGPLVRNLHPIWCSWVAGCPTKEAPSKQSRRQRKTFTQPAVDPMARVVRICAVQCGYRPKGFQGVTSIASPGVCQSYASSPLVSRSDTPSWIGHQAEKGSMIASIPKHSTYSDPSRYHPNVYASYYASVWDG